jgi:hypothetical protein
MRTSLSRRSNLINTHPSYTIASRVLVRSLIGSPTSATTGQHPGRSPLHTTSRPYDSERRSWLHRKHGMRGRLKALADSIGLTSQDEPRPMTEESVGEELFVMPGWAVAKRRSDVEASTSLASADTTLCESLYQDYAHPAVPFDLHVSISGYCSLARPASLTTRTQRVMVSLVRRKFNQGDKD